MPSIFGCFSTREDSAGDAHNAVRGEVPRCARHLMRINPVFAALIGSLVLQEDLGAAQWFGVGLIFAASAGTLLLRGRRGS